MEEKQNRQEETASRHSRAMLFVLFLLSAAVTVMLSVPGFVRFSDETFGSLFTETAPRFAVSVFLLAVLVTTEEYRGGLLLPKRCGRALLWSIPCLLVAFANFPYSALASGGARVVRADLLWLFVLKCFFVALLEELFFRALLVPLVRARMKGRLAAGWTVLITAAVFGLSHLLNLFFGAGVGPTLLQTGYTFLLGCMFAAMFLKTESVWPCVLVHFLFDIGGVLISDLGTGGPQDTVFWILTAVTGVLCAIHIVWTVIGLMKPKEEKHGAV